MQKYIYYKKRKQHNEVIKTVDSIKTQSTVFFTKSTIWITVELNLFC